MRFVAPPIHSSDNETVFGELIGRVDDWNLPLSKSPLPFEELDQDFLLGSSRTGDLWIFAAFPFNGLDSAGFSLEDAHLAALIDPPKRDAEVIAEVLLRVHRARMSGDEREEPLYEEILREVPFPVYRELKHLLPEAPPEWHDLPVELFVNFELSEGGCITRGLFEEYKRDSLEDALNVLFEPRVDFMLIGYGLAARGAVPLLAWDVEWPLSRRGKEAPTRREKRQGPYPWQYEASPVLLYVRQYIRSSNMYGTPPAFGEPSIRLRVGGRSPEHAVSNHQQCAKGLRRIKRRLETKRKLSE